MFFQVDDQLQVNAKTRALAEALLDGDFEGLAALGLWTMTGSLCQAGLTDGLVTRTDLARLVLNLPAAMQLASRLVTVGLWHAPGHECDRCPPLSPGTWIFHDWFDLKYDRAAQVKTTRRKRVELQDRYLIAQVWARDCDDTPKATRGKCRYCGRMLKRADRKSAYMWQLDHVDPALAVGVENVVLACHPCNREKGRRTPEIAGMTLLPAPRRSSAVVEHRADVDAPTPVDHAPVADDPGAAHRRDVADHHNRETLRDAAVEGVSEPPGRITGDINLISPVISPPHEVVSDARAGAHGGRAGQGGVTQGRGGKGPVGSGRARRGRGRRRGRRAEQSEDSSRTGPPPHENPPHGRAGQAPPDVPLPPGQFGSPWHGYRGGDRTDELRCTEHDLPAPCRKCIRGES